MDSEAEDIRCLYEEKEEEIIVGKYTEQEIEELLRSLNYIYNDVQENPGSKLRYTCSPQRITYEKAMEDTENCYIVAEMSTGGRFGEISVGHLIEILRTPKPKKTREASSLNIMINFVELEEVPLYMNDFPEVAQWRLRIGK